MFLCFFKYFKTDIKKFELRKFLFQIEGHNRVKLKSIKNNSEEVRAWKAEIKESKKQEQYEKILREKMEFEQARRFREENKI